MSVKKSHKENCNGAFATRWHYWCHCQGWVARMFAAIMNKVFLSGKLLYSLVEDFKSYKSKKAPNLTILLFASHQQIIMSLSRVNKFKKGKVFASLKNWHTRLKWMQRGQGFKAMQVGCKLFEEAKKRQSEDKGSFYTKKVTGQEKLWWGCELKMTDDKFKALSAKWNEDDKGDRIERTPLWASWNKPNTEGGAVAEWSKALL